MRAIHLGLSLLLSSLLVGCGGGEEPRQSPPASAGAQAPPAASAPVQPGPARPAPAQPASAGGPSNPSATFHPAPPRPEASLVVFLGDSLTAGYGLAEDQAYPALIRERLAAEGIAARVVNAGISGDTTAGGLARLDWVLKQKPSVVVVALGGNDGLRGFPLAETESNLRRIVERVRAAGAAPLLAGMMIPPNYGPDYAQGFAALYPRLARELDVPLIPFLLAGVAAEVDLNQPDGIHPTAEGQKVLAKTVLQYLRPLLAPAS